MNIKKVRNSLLIGIDQGNDALEFFDSCGNLLAVGYTRVVIGKRGTYIEFEKKHIKWEHFHIPGSEVYRETDLRVFYIECRSSDTSHVKLYLQKRTVAYADYKIGMCYIAPSDLFRAEMQPVIISS